MLDRLKRLLGDRRKVMIGAVVIGGMLGLLALRKRSASAAAAPTTPTQTAEVLSYGNMPYNFGGSDASMIDSTSAATFSEGLTSLTSSVDSSTGYLGDIGSTVSTLTDVVAGLTGKVDAVMSSITTPAVTATPTPPAVANPGTPVAGGNAVTPAAGGGSAAKPGEKIEGYTLAYWGQSPWSKTPKNVPWVKAGAQTIVHPNWAPGAVHGPPAGTKKV